MGTGPLTELEVVAVRYWASGRERQGVCALDGYEVEKVYASAGVPFTVAEPELPDGEYASDTEVLGAIGGAIAGVVAAASREGRGVLLVGGNCTHMPGVIGGLQDAHGAGVRIGLVWFDAHGDFNTPETSLTGFLGGMPVAVCAGLAHPEWREGSHIAAPLPTDRIVMVDVRNLDHDEERLIRATDVIIAAAGRERAGEDLGIAVSELADRCDLLYLHIDADVLDETLVPAHRTREPRGPGLEELSVAVDTVMATGKVVAYAVVSVCGSPDEGEVDMASGAALVRAGLESWARHGMPESI